MSKRTIMGVHAPPPRLTRTAMFGVALTLGMLIVLLGLTLDSVIAPLFNAG